MIRQWKKAGGGGVMLFGILLAAWSPLPPSQVGATTQGCGIKTDYEAYTEPAPPQLPAAGGRFIDPTFCTTILRVTDASDGDFNATAYSYWPTFNRDNSRLFVLNRTAPQLYSFNAVKFTVAGKRNLFIPAGTPDYESPGAEDACWSGLNRDEIYTHVYGLKLWRYNVVTQTYLLVKDFGADVGPGKPLRADTRHLVQMSKSQDDDVFAFHLTDEADRIIGYLAWRRADDGYYAQFSPPPTVNEFDEVQVDKSGHYLVVKRDPGRRSEFRTLIVDLQTRRTVGLTASPPDYGFGHSDLGRGVAVSHDDECNRVLRRDLADPLSIFTLFDMGGCKPKRAESFVDWTIGEHISLLADDETWALVSTYAIANGHPSKNKFRGEIFQVKTDGSGQVRRLAHTQSVYDGEYWATPRANISRDGKYIAFTSNWGVSRGRLDVFIVAAAAGK